MLKILIAEDEAQNREVLTELLQRLGHHVEAAVDGQDALERFAQRSFDVVLSDLRMPRMDGLRFFEALRKLLPAEVAMPPFAFMTAYGRLEEAVEAMRQGAVHFLTKPLRKKDVVALLEQMSRLVEARGQALLSQGKPNPGTPEPVFVSRAFGEVVRMVDRVAESLTSVLFVGESGTGKEILARRLHERSGRAAYPFVAFHAGAMPETLLESELFGHEKGAFTGAELSRMGQIRSAHRGTFFLDELATMPLGVQTKLLRVVQDRMVMPLGASHPIECDVRWVAATNADLDALVAQGRFRGDLLYRLRVLSIELPPLRSRPEDIEVLTKSFMTEFAARENRAPLAIPPQTAAMLANYQWPGNVRELRNVVERAVTLATNDVFSPDLLPPHVAQPGARREIRVPLGTSLESAQDQLIEQTLALCAGDKAQAAAILGVAPRTIYRWLERKSEGWHGGT